MIWRDFKNNVIEIANLALEALDQYKDYYQDYLSHNHLRSMLKARMSRCDADAHIWDLCVIDKYCEKLLSTQNKDGIDSIDYLKVPWDTPDGVQKFNLIETNLHKIIKHEKDKEDTK